MNITQWSVGRAGVGEWECDTIEQFGTKLDVLHDGNHGYHSITITMKYMRRDCMDAVEKVRKDIWKIASNCTHY